MTTDAQLDAALDAAMALLIEHADAIQILVSFEEQGSTYSTRRGAGNWHARQHMAWDFFNKAKSQTLAEEIKRVEED